MSGFYDGVLYAASVFVGLETMPLPVLARRLQAYTQRLGVLMGAYRHVHIDECRSCTGYDIIKGHHTERAVPKFVAEWIIGYISLAVSLMDREINQRMDITEL